MKIQRTFSKDRKSEEIPGLECESCREYGKMISLRRSAAPLLGQILFASFKT